MNWHPTCPYIMKPVQWITRHNEPWMEPVRMPKHDTGAFNFKLKGEEPEIGGWACLKILCTPGHPQREMIQRRVHLVTRTVGDKYLKLLATVEMAYGGLADEPDFEHGGGQYVDHKDKAVLRLSPEEEFRELNFHFDVEDHSLAIGNVESFSLPDEQELDDAREEAMQELEMLKHCGYKVSYCDKLGRWRERWPRIGDMVDIPRDLNADLESEEPLEARPSAATHLYDDRWFDNHRPNYMSFDPDPLVQKRRLWDFCNDNDVNFSILADRKGRNMWEVAVWKLSERGKLIVSESVQERYGLRPKRVNGEYVFTPGRLCKFLMWAYHKASKNKWEFSWICKSIFVLEQEPVRWRPLVKVHGVYYPTKTEFTKNRLVS